MSEVEPNFKERRKHLVLDLSRRKSCTDREKLACLARDDVWQPHAMIMYAVGYMCDLSELIGSGTARKKARGNESVAPRRRHVISKRGAYGDVEAGSTAFSPTLATHDHAISGEVRAKPAVGSASTLQCHQHAAEFLVVGNLAPSRFPPYMKRSLTIPLCVKVGLDKIL